MIQPLLSRRRPNISNETIKTTLSSTGTVREVRRVSIEDQTTANTSEKEEERHQMVSP
jgi:hypothetical protein